MSHIGPNHQPKMNAIFGKSGYLPLPLPFPRFGARGTFPQIA
jgi:hypothetical protein